MINQIDIDNANYTLNTNIRNRVQLHMHEYICIGYMIDYHQFYRVKKTKAYRRYIEIRNIINQSRYKNILLNMVGQELHKKGKYDR